MWRTVFWTVSGATAAGVITALNNVIGTDIGTGEKVLSIAHWQVVTNVAPFVVVIEVIVAFP